MLEPVNVSLNRRGPWQVKCSFLFFPFHNLISRDLVLRTGNVLGVPSRIFLPFRNFQFSNEYSQPLECNFPFVLASAGHTRLNYSQPTANVKYASFTAIQSTLNWDSTIQLFHSLKLNQLCGVCAQSKWTMATSGVASLAWRQFFSVLNRWHDKIADARRCSKESVELPLIRHVYLLNCRNKKLSNKKPL